jgi:phosphatidylglycerol:prolipoprotein diacylglycerol transferase
MIPILLDLGRIKVYSFGLMLALGFLGGSYILSRELQRRKINPDFGTWITLIAVVCGIGGAKLLYLLENWDLVRRDPIGEAFSPGGLTWYGGFILALAAVTLYVHLKKVPFLKVWDCLGIALMIGYGVGRIGCHLAGDGDYGTPTTLPWGTIYAQGIVKPSSQLQEYFAANPAEAERWKYDSLRTIRAGVDRRGLPYSRFDEQTPLHPTPVYEFLLGLLGFAALLELQKRRPPPGILFMGYLVLAGAFRFIIEYLRLNPRLAFGLSEAQLIAVPLMLLGLIGAALLLRRHHPAAH